MSQDSAQELFNGFLSSYLGTSPTEFQVYCLQIPSVSQGVVCFHSVGLGCSWTFTVIVFKDPRGSTLFVSMYISLAFLFGNLPKRHMWGVFLIILIGFY